MPLNLSDESMAELAFQYASSLCPDRYDAEDLAHDAWVKLKESGKLLVGKRYVFLTVKSLFLDRVATFRKREQILQSRPADPYYSPNLIESDPLIWRAYRGLTVMQREVLYLNIVHDWSTSKIGKFMQVSRNTVLSHLRRGKKALEVAYIELGGQP